MKLTIRPAGRGDIYAMSPHLRVQDQRELLALHNNIHDTLLQAFETSEEVYVISFNDELDPVVLFGVSRPPAPNDSIGVPWMVATDDVARGSIAILRAGRQYFEQWRKKFILLFNITCTQNVLYSRWLRLIGCTLGDPITLNGHEFRPFFYP